MIKVAIVMGGYSSEYLISLKSGQVVYDQLDRTKYEPYKVHIFKEKWVLVLDNGIEYPIDKNDFSATINGEKITFDVVFNAIHGTPGEDGFLQAYFELIQLPIRSEERRVGKECRSRWSPYH